MGGRPTAYKEEMVEKAELYINGGYKELEQIIPSVVGLAIHLNVAKSTLYKWAENKEHPFSDILKKTTEMQEITLLNGGLSNRLNSAITKLALGKHGYSDKIEQTNKNIDLDSLSDKDLAYVAEHGELPPA